MSEKIREQRKAKDIIIVKVFLGIILQVIVIVITVLITREIVRYNFLRWFL